MDYEKDFEEGYVHTSSGRIYFRRHRAGGRKFIFVHAMGSTTKEWARLMGYLPDDCDVSLIDLLGHGRSDAPENFDYTISSQVQALQEFVADQNNGSSFIVGHSYGGWIAAYYVSYNYPAKGLVLEASAGLEHESEFRKDRWQDEADDGMLKRLLMLDNKEYVMRSIISNSSKEELTEDALASIRKPTLIIWGEQDNILDPKFAQVFNEHISGSRVEIMQGAGHSPQYTHPEEFAALLLDFAR
ncbi:MAG: alpha/beta hydrolase [Candidatus Micrarchaeota archaeon]|nr:alpha/beta hydrolase [Candidatus Micrarchaeota archaeon]MDE1804507.1 alpha/beta hydrolase [Candidatus Micrarchaeota archaeon]MDE1846436.1 alpha/beta hydrolase [Candidatus Micrarchaeota archaeon]